MIGRKKAVILILRGFNKHYNINDHVYGKQETPGSGRKATHQKITELAKEVDSKDEQIASKSLRLFVVLKSDHTTPQKVFLWAFAPFSFITKKCLKFISGALKTSMFPHSNTIILFTRMIQF